ncbi:thiamine phosphate synthase superfamily [Dunaliella salina]|uniref:Thiamine phosphate synthase superfamily n=1 Tax=Dunaliella salina TaxID=3046 RepID=A0ABQ7H2R8_DUNSA|nr:thiamine phosphate synthase superfamily [Dunaliella salina]|eukprot:KAF5841151.1 thiamine phosphate synthase superfamily [Dunaliella salina]
MASRLIVISPPGMIPKEAATLNRLFASGLQCYHARKPECSLETVRQLLAAVDPQYHPHIRLHQHHQLAQDFDVGGIHYPTKVLPPLPLQPYVVDSHRGSQSPSMAGSEGDALDSNFGAMSSTSRRTLVQSTSLHSLEDLQGGKARYGALDYAFLSPIFDSISKKGYAAAKFDPVQLRTLLQEHGKQLPVIALGGISAENCLQALDMGFQGVAVLGSIWEAQDPVAEMERFMQQLQKHA